MEKMQARTNTGLGSVRRQVSSESEVAAVFTSLAATTYVLCRQLISPTDGQHIPRYSSVMHIFLMENL